MSWAHWPFNNCLGTLASHHCNNTLFKMGVQNLGCYTTPSLEEAPSKNIFETEVMGGKYSQREMDFFLILRGGSGTMVSCNKMDPKSVSSAKIGCLVGFSLSLMM
jgi:hypothetical protein